MTDTHMKKVKSSAINSVGHRDDVLDIEFKSGRRFSYSDVPKRVYDELMDADSIGRYFNLNIRNHYVHS
jgi:hypothetical protein